MPNDKAQFVGIDMSKDWFDVAVMHKEICEYEKGNSRVQWMCQLQPQLMVVEATGGYEEARVLALFEAGLPVALMSP